MRTFVRVVECASFTKAADTLGVPRSTVSTAIRELEERVGTRLLNRTTRVVAPTIDGVAFCERCLSLIADYEEVEGLFRHSAGNTRGTLRVNVPGRIGRLIVAPALSEFVSQYPEIELELGVTDRVVDLHQDGIDCVVRVGELNDSGLIARRIGEIRIINCASPAYIEKHGTPRRPTDLNRHWSVAYRSHILGRLEPWEYAHQEGTTAITMKSKVAVDNAEMLIALGLAGFGIIQAPAYDVHDHIVRGELHEIMPRHRPSPMPLHVLYPHRRHLSRRLQVFIDWLVTTLERWVVDRKGAKIDRLP